MSQEPKTVRTRVCIISDTHTRAPLPADNKNHAYRYPLPKADVLLHAGDITNEGYLSEYETIFEVLEAADAELKIIIAGNHDITLDEEYYARETRKKSVHGGKAIDPKAVKELWAGEKAKAAGIMYLEEGTNTIELKNGATFTIYTSPFQPEFCNWAFAYHRWQDRFNPPLPDAKFKAPNPIPSWPAIDIMMTHGPPHGILDQVLFRSENVGCENLRKALQRCKPRLHCFGHIHEAWGAERHNWSSNTAETIEVSDKRMISDRCAHIDVSKRGHKPLKFGEETIFINAAIMSVHYHVAHAPWVVDLDLPFSKPIASESTDP